MINWLKSYFKAYCTYKITDNELIIYQAAIMCLTLALTLVLVGVGWWYIKTIGGGMITVDKEFTWDSLFGMAGVIGIIGLALYMIVQWKLYKSKEVIK